MCKTIFFSPPFLFSVMYWEIFQRETELHRDEEISFCYLAFECLCESLLDCFELWPVAGGHLSLLEVFLMMHFSDCPILQSGTLCAIVLPYFGTLRALLCCSILALRHASKNVSIRFVPVNSLEPTSAVYSAHV